MLLFVPSGMDDTSSRQAWRQLGHSQGADTLACSAEDGGACKELHMRWALNQGAVPEPAVQLTKVTHL